MERADLKHEAQGLLSGRWGWAVGFYFVGNLMAIAIGYFTFGLLSILTAMVMVGVSFTFLDMVDDNGEERGMFNQIFSAFTNGQAMAVFLNTLLAVIFATLWTMLLIVPGIIKMFAYSQTTYILRDMQRSGCKIGATDAIRASRSLMRGHKWEYFDLQLSFIGWALLALLTLNIGTLWLAPYMETTNAVYYRHLAGDRFLDPEAEIEF